MDTIDSGDWAGNGLIFDGNDDWVSITQMNFTNVTLEAVFTPTNVSKGSEQGIIANVESGGYEIIIEAAGTGQFYSYIASGYRGATAISLTNNTKYSFSGSYNGSRIRNRCNSTTTELAYTGSITAPGSSTIMILGGNPSGSSAGGSYFAGTIHSVRIYSRGLTNEEMETNYKADQDRFGV